MALYEDNSAGNLSITGGSMSEDPQTTQMNISRFATETQRFQSYWEASVEHDFVLMLRTYAPPVITIAGIVGNLIAFSVLRPRHKLMPVAPSVRYYLSVLLMVDSVNLVFGCGLEWISSITGSDPVANINDWTCKLYQFSFNILMYSSYWLVLLLVVDRFICVSYRQLSPNICTAFTAKVLTAFVYIGMVSISVHTMWTYEVSSYRNIGCNIDVRQQDMYTTVWPWIAAVLNSYLPIAIITVITILLLVQSTSQKKTDPKQYLPLVITLAIVFVCLTLPSIILNFIDYSKPAWLINYQRYACLLALAEMFQKLGSLNHAIKHVVCFICCREMRNKLRHLCHKTELTVEHEEEATHMVPRPDAGTIDAV